LLSQGTPELKQDAGFADACFSGEAGDLPMSALDLVEEFLQCGELTLAADKRGEAALGRDVKGRLAPARPEHLNGLDRRVSFDDEFAQIASVEVPGDETLSGLAHEHASRTSVLLKPESDVRGIAYSGVVHPEVVADLADHDGTGIDADAHLKWPAEP
jgi:hypothetical protein